MPIYLWLDIGSLIVPFIFSFHPALRFDKEWRYVFPGILGSLLLYVIWDVIFTKTGVWGFAPEHLIGVEFLHLPLEEWLFFICIPYACLFTHHCLGVLKPNWKLSIRSVNYLGIGLIGLWIFMAIFYNNRTYTLVNSLWAIVLLGYVLWKHKALLQRFIITYLFILVPFLLVNGVLTGSCLDYPIVWYNDMENMGLRLLTIPFEDFTYAFTMLLFPLLLAKGLKRI